MRSSVKQSRANDNLDDDLVGRTRKVWQPRLGRELSREDARQIAANMTGFFAVLAKWSSAERPSPPVIRARPPSPSRRRQHDR